ncbi:MAG: hypothetical protein WC753_02740 [Candidatus Gracilibacteria bacterium]
MAPLSPKAELIKLEYSLSLSQRTSEGLLKYKKKTQCDVKKILWECGLQIRLIDDFTQTEAFNCLGNDQRYLLNQQQMNAENIYHELSQK